MRRTARRLGFVVLLAVMAANRPVSERPAPDNTKEPGSAKTGYAGKAFLQDGWSAEVQASIRRAEYNVTRQEQSVAGGESATLHAANRANNLRSYFRQTGVEILERKPSIQNWLLHFCLKGWGRRGSMSDVCAAAPDSAPSSNRVTYSRSGLSEWYENSEKGLEHGLVVGERPGGTGELVVEGIFDGNVVAHLDSSRDSVRFLDPKGREVLRYEKLVAKDALGRLLPAHMELSRLPGAVDGVLAEGAGDDSRTSRLLALCIDDAAAVYPVSIDPIYIPPPPASTNCALTCVTETEGGQAVASFGFCVAGAGDINGDGYADVIVGAPNYDSGVADGGAAFLFLGSSSGLVGTSPVTAACVLGGDQEFAAFGYSVAGAGDVNGDGYADVVVGAPYYDDGEMDEGAAFVFLGSATGLIGTTAGTACARLESDQDGAFFGSSVAGAGDVNGDGYADLIIGAPQYSGDEPYEGAAFLFLGSASGSIGASPATAAATLESHVVNALFGSSVAGAGDVNGDGYADVIVGAPQYNDGEALEGGAFIFLGGAGGLAGTDPTTAATVLQSNLAETFLGTSVAGAGDVNGDGYADVLVGAPAYVNADGGGGAAFLFQGSPTGIVGTTCTTAAVTIGSDQADAKLGMCVSGAGDLNGDGYADVVVGAPDYDSGQTDEGAVFLFLGSPVGLRGTGTAMASTVLEGNQENARFGYTASGVGDVNGDGYADVFVGAPGYTKHETGEGAAFLFLGSPAGVAGTGPATAAAAMGSDTPNAYLGGSVAGAGDVNGDGYADVIVGAPYYDNGKVHEGGAVFLFLGSASGLVGTGPATAAAVIESDLEDSAFGLSVASAGDVNGDGYADVIIGAPQYWNAYGGMGAAFLFLGSPSGLVSCGPGAANTMIGSAEWNVGFGASVASAGDVNGDGYADVLVGAPGYDNGEVGEGAAFLFLGSAGGLIGTSPVTAAAVFESDQENAYLGLDVAGAGDVNGDGYADIVVGAPYYDKGQVDEGAVFVFLGSPSGPTGTDPASAVAVLEGDQADGHLGHEVACAGDVNGDGYADIIVGAPDYDNGESDEGAAFLFVGCPSGVSGTGPRTAASIVEGNQARGIFGGSVTGAGDVNGDGYADVLVGAPGYDGAETDEGAVFLFLGSPTGLPGDDPSRAAAILLGGQANACLGSSVAGAGDVEGDGFADVVVGAPYYDGAEQDEGAAVLFRGNVNASLSRGPRFYRSDGLPVSTPGLNIGATGLRLQMDAVCPPTGAMAAKMEWEIKPYGSTFDGDGTRVSSGWFDASSVRHRFDESFDVPDEANGFRWRARILYMPLNLFQRGAREAELTPKPGIVLPAKPQHGPWFRPQWVTVGPSDFRTSTYLPPMSPAGLTIAQTSLTTTDDIVCMLASPSTSPAVPPRSIQYRYVWSNGSRTVEHTTDAISDTLSASETRKHEIWTCAVSAWDGVQPSHDHAEATAPEIANTVPGIPTVRIVTATEGRQSRGTNMICRVEVTGRDPDADEQVESVLYQFQWYRNGEAAQIQRFGSSLTGQVNSEDLIPGDYWCCVVTPKDNEAQGEAGATADIEVVQGGVTPSFISANISPTEVRLGEMVSISGTIFPSPLGSTIVSFTSNCPSGLVSDEFPESAATGTARYHRSFYPTEATVGRSPWSVRASWQGDGTYAAATSDPVTFTVLRTAPSVRVQLNVSSAPLNYTGLQVTVVLDASLPAALAPLTSDQTLRLYAQKPDLTVLPPIAVRTNTDGRAILAGADLAAWAFDAPGTWKFTASFDGDANLLPSASPGVDQPECPRLTIKDRAGYAIIVVGQFDAEAEGHKEHAKTADFVYRSLRDRGFAVEDINYLRGTVPGYPPPSDISVSASTPSQAGIQEAIEQWALRKMTATPGPLYLVLIDHGAPNQFYVYSGSYDETRVVSPEELNAYLTALEDGVAIAEKPAQDIITVYGACHSGSFVPGLASRGLPNPERHKRTIITSTSPDQVSYRGVEADGIRDGEAFVTELFRQLSAGKTLKEGFELASGKIGEYTAENTNGVQGLHTQTPQLDDNADGVPTPAASLSFASGEDGARAHGIVLGYGVNGTRNASWIAVTPTVTLAVGDQMPPLWALCDRIPATGLKAWLEVKTPTYEGGTPVSAEPGAQNKVELSRVASEATEADLSAGFFRWNSFGALFDLPGTYKVFYYVEDGGTVSSHLVTTVYRMADANQAPAPPRLVLPADGADSKSTALLAWEPSSDPDGDPVTYRVEVSSDPSFPSVGLIVKEGLVSPFAVLTPSDGLQDLHTYYWRVIAVDVFGAQSQQNAERHFRVFNDNSSLLGWVSGQVRETGNGAPIAGATVHLDSMEAQTLSDGTFLFALIMPGSHVLRAEEEMFEPSSRSVVVTAGFGAPGDLELTRLNLPPTVTLSTTANNETNVSPIRVTATLSKPSTDFGAGDVQVTEAVLGGFSGSGAVYSFDLAPSNADVSVTVRIASGAFHDLDMSPCSASNTLIIHYDTIAPLAPMVSSTTPTISARPTWRWSSNGSDGCGVSRYSLDDEGIWHTTTSNEFTPLTPLGIGPHALSVQERDEAGNWSGAGSFTVTVIPAVTLSGHVSCADEGVACVVLEGLPETVLTDGNGDYQCDVPVEWHGTVTPALTGYTFSPPSRTYPSNSTTGQDYTASCTALSVPTGVQATDGTESSCVRVSWASVVDAAGYDVYRSETSDSKTAQKLNVSPVTTQSYSDTTAAPPEVTSGNGCSSGETVAYFHYFYWVKALGANPCNASALSASDEGYRGRASAKALYETVLPKADADGFVQIAGTETRLCVRLRSIVPIAPDSVWGMVTSSSVWESDAMTWVPVSDTDGWVVYVPDHAWTAGETISMTIGATDTAGAPIPAASVQYLVGGASADGVAVTKIQQPLHASETGNTEGGATSIDGILVSESSGDPPNAATCEIGPSEAYLTPQRVWLPVPQGTEPSNLKLYYLFNDEWVAADSVDGLLVTDSLQITEEDGLVYCSIAVRHGGVLRLAPASAQPPQPSEAGVLATGIGAPGRAGDLLILALAVLVLSGRRFRRGVADR